MQPSSATAATIRTRGLRRCLRARVDMGGASLLAFDLLAVEVGGGCLIAVVDLGRVDDRGVVASNDGHVQRVTDGRGLSVGLRCTPRANPAAAILGAGGIGVGG